MTTVVLGWDGLDAALLARYDCGDAFGADTRRIETITNPELDKPHTWELWPSIITGEPPAVHGVHAHEHTESGWANPGVRVLASLSRPLPERLRWWGGRLLRDAGAGMAFERLERYDSTVFDGYDAVPIAIPNARSAFDDALEIEADRGQSLAAYLDSAGDGGQREATVPIEQLRARVAADAGGKLAMVESIYPDHDLVVVWLAYLDTLGHVAPTVADPERLRRDAYHRAADWTRELRATLGEQDTLLCVSDHGLQAGEHTAHAVVSGPADTLTGVESVLDVREAIEACTDADSATSAPTAEDADAVDEVHERLAELGYVE